MNFGDNAFRTLPVGYFRVYLAGDFKQAAAGNGRKQPACAVVSTVKNLRAYEDGVRRIARGQAMLQLAYPLKDEKPAFSPLRRLLLQRQEFPDLGILCRCDDFRHFCSSLFSDFSTFSGLI